MSTQTLKELEKLYSKQELLDLVATRRAEQDAREHAEHRNHLRNEAIKEIKAHLAQAERSLRAAGDIGSTYGISFEFVGPKNDTDQFRPNWQSSACYVSDGWYSEGDFGYGYQQRNVSTVEGEPIEVLDSSNTYNWQSSSADC